VVLQVVVLLRGYRPSACLSLALAVARDYLGAAEVLAGGWVLDVREYPAEHVNVRTVPLADPSPVAKLTGNSSDLTVLVIVIDRESPLASGGRWVRDILEADGALSTLEPHYGGVHACRDAESAPDPGCPVPERALGCG